MHCTHCRGGAHRDRDELVVADSRQFPRVRLHTVVSFAPTPLGTLLTERMSIEAPRPPAAVTVRQAVAAHQEMLRGIAARFADHA